MMTTSIVLMSTHHAGHRYRYFPIVYLIMVSLSTLLLTCCHGQTTTTTTNPTTTIETNHQVKFQGMRHNYPNQELARQALAKILNDFIGHSISVDQIEDQTIVWHAKNMTQLNGYQANECPEKELKELLDKFRRQDSQELTREFKMQLTEDFTYPEAISIDWLGPCEKIAAKRSQMGAAPSDRQNESTTTMSSSSIQVESTTNIDSSISNLQSLETEEVAPTTPTEQPITQPPTTISDDVDDDDDDNSNQANSDDGSGATRSSLGSLPPSETEGESDSSSGSAGSGFEAISFDKMDSLFSFKSTSTTPEPTMNLTTLSSSSAETMSTTTSMDATITTTSATTTTTTTSMDGTTTLKDASFTFSPISTTITTTSTTQVPVETSSGEILDEDGIGASSTDRKLLATREESTLISKGRSSEASLDDGPYYGKYIGLALAFAIFVAYLLVSRSYSTQGRYEVHRG